MKNKTKYKYNIYDIRMIKGIFKFSVILAMIYTLIMLILYHLA